MRLAVILVIAVSWGFPVSLWAQESPREITVTGEGRVSSEPDMAVIVLGVTREARTAGTRRIVTDILKLEQRNGKTLYGKTGWTIAPDPDIGWFVGWVDDGQDKHVFALNMDVHSRADARLRKKLALQLLSQLGIY